MVTSKATKARTLEQAEKLFPGGVASWHFLNDNGKMTRYTMGIGRPTGQTPKAGRNYHVDGFIALCFNGLHASREIEQALAHAPGTIIQRCWSHGVHVEQYNNKLASSERLSLWIVDAGPTMRRVAIEVAVELVQEYAHCLTENETERVLAVLKGSKESLPAGLPPRLAHMVDVVTNSHSALTTFYAVRDFAGSREHTRDIGASCIPRLVAAIEALAPQQ
jgi:hypothetical protein